MLGLGLVLGAVHILATAGVTLQSALVVASVAVALSWRVLRANCGVGARPYEVYSVNRPASRVVEVSLRPFAIPIAVTSGQFVMAAFFEGPLFRGCGEFHPYTVSAAAADGTLSLSIKALGDCTRHIQSLHASSLLQHYRIGVLQPEQANPGVPSDKSLRGGALAQVCRTRPSAIGQCAR